MIKKHAFLPTFVTQHTHRPTLIRQGLIIKGLGVSKN